VADRLYKQITVRLYGKGVIERGVVLGRQVKTRPQFLAHANDLIMSRIDARNGAFGIIPPSLEEGIVTQDFPMFRVDTEVVLEKYLALVLTSEEFVEICKRSSRGTTNRKRLNEDAFLSEELSFPNKEVQKEILEFYDVLASITLSSENAMKVGSEMERNICNTLARQSL
jgi:restriction endonuclease S subunit